MNQLELLHKASIIQRVNSTTLLSANNVFTIEEWVRGDEALSINWVISNTIVGEALIAASPRGVCFLGFINGDVAFAMGDMKRRFPLNQFMKGETPYMSEAIHHLNNAANNPPVRLHLKGTAFQLNVWKQLMRIPFSGLITYKALGSTAQNARATGTAVGANPVSYIVPCHRAVRSDGSFDRYYWGEAVKRSLITYEGGTGL